MSIYKELSYDQYIDVVRGIQFGVLSPEEIERRSVVEVKKTDTYSGSDPIVDGLFDPRMGVLEHSRVCATCEQKNNFCPGHFGHIKLARPVFHAMFFDHIKRLLKCVCYRCSRLLVSENSTHVDIRETVKKAQSIKNLEKRNAVMFKLCSNNNKLKKCGDGNPGGCNCRQPSKYYKENALKIMAEWKEPGMQPERKEFTPEEILRIFQRISEKDMELLGFNPKWNRPEWMICTVLPVPPPSVRPSIIEENGQRREDDLTHKLCDIIKTNNQLKQRIERGNATEEQLRLTTMVLQYHVATFVDNQLPGIPPAQQRNGRRLKSLCDRLKKKEGRIRGNLNGKRVDQSARSVITPDPYISLDELGVPIKVALNLTFPETVNALNKAHLQKLVRTGPDVWPGAKYVRKASNGNTFSLRLSPEKRDEIAGELHEGDIVDRHLSDGDYVLFNRQPSLHKMSMMCHRAKVMPYNTFRLNVLVTSPYNADFDGDEMNAHAPQSIQTMCELMDFASVPYHTITPKDAQPIIEVVQDTMLGAYRLTKSHVRMPDKVIANLQMVNSYFKGSVPEPDDKEQQLYTGRQAYSMILPPSLYLKAKNKAGGVVTIEDSIMTDGVIDKSAYTAMSRGILPVLFHDYGPFEVRRFMDNTQRLICRWLVTSGFSVGISDLVIPDSIHNEIKDKIQEKKIEAYKKIEAVRKGDIANTSMMNNHDFLESEIINILNELNSHIGKKVSDTLDDNINRLVNMVKSGSKGKPQNVAQMIANVGQQNVDGKRVAYGFTDRTLPHYSKYDDGPDARGFVENSFISGLTPQEVFFHAMGGREGLIDTAVKSVTGDTPVIVMENGVSKYVKIGDWIDQYMEKYPRDIIIEEDRPDLEFLKLDDKVDVYIPTGDNKGTVTWGKLTAVTRHDPTDAIYEVETASGRKVTVADSESLLVWDAKTESYTKKQSSLVQEGDYLPVVMNLSTPPTVTEYVDMSTYFPKNTHVYGTEFNTCVKLMKEAQGDKYHIPSGWYEDNNGKVFTLPYTSKARVQRVVARSNTENINDGCIYPYHATREHSYLPDKFVLDYENGVFIGLYLADGCVHEASGTISISKNDKSVQDFVCKWFDKYNITHRMNVTHNNHGTSTSIIGSATLFARFLQMFVGHGARTKHIPDVAYTAPEDFVKGLLSGYISGDGSIHKGSITTSSASQRLTEGIAYLCTRLGVFGKMSSLVLKSNNLDTQDIAPVYRLSIRAQWAKKLAKSIELVHAVKQQTLREMTFTDEHRNFKQTHDTVMDPVVKITKMNGWEVCAKMYDVTVPSTCNFVISSGINLYDTSETGYIQRRLVKAMEDCKVYYDQTVRNASGNIVQFIYGEDGMEGTKIELQAYPILNMSTVDIEKSYNLRPEDNIERYLNAEGKKTLKKEKKWVDRCAEHYRTILADREKLIVDVFHKSNDITVQYPIPFARIIENAYQRAKSLGATNFPTDLTPEYVLDKIEELKKALYVIEDQGIFFLHLLLHVHLSPKAMILKYRFSKSMFDWIVSEIERYFHEAVAPPGEMVGIIAAQSMGEPATQLSTSSDTRIRITCGQGQDATKHYTGEIGMFIDRLLAENAENVMDLGNDSSALYLKDDYYIIGVSNDEKTSWRRILEVSRHPANGGMVTVHTKSGRKTTATLSHSFLKRTTNGIEPIEGSKLKVGDYIPVTRKIPTIENPMNSQWIGGKAMTLDKDFGWLVGAYLADGNINGTSLSISKTDPVFEERLHAFCLKHGYTLRVREHTGTIDMDVRYADRTYTSKTMTICGTEAIHFAKWVLQNFNTGSYQKSIPAWVYASNKDFIAGILSGYFDGDGNVNVERQMVRAHSVNKGLIEDMSILLNYCGIFATMREETRKHEKANKFYVLTLNRKYASAFKETIGFHISHKSENLDKIIEYNNRDTIHSVQEMIDQIPECGESIAYIGERLALPEQSRMYKRWLKKKAIGRRTLEKYVALFKAMNDLSGNLPDVTEHIAKLELALKADIVWDQIVELTYLPDPKTYVYDFTVPGNDSFMVDNGVLVHNTLDSFHVSGTAAAVKATSGVPRLKELLSVSKNIKTPSLTIYLKKEVGTVVDPIQEEGADGQTMNDPRIAELKDRALHIRNQFEITRLSYLLDSTEIFWDPPGNGFETSIEEDKGLLALYREFEEVTSCQSTSPWLLRMKINKARLHESGLTMMDVYMKLYEAYSQNMECVFSDDNAEELVLRIRLANEKEKKKTEEEEAEAEEGEIDTEDDAVASLKALEHNIVHNLILKGIQGIKKVSMRSNERKEYNTSLGTFQTLKEWIMQTDGSNLLEILCNPNVDASRTVSNDVWEIFEAYGIEAARTALYNEIMDVIRESSVNYRHISLLIDTMTHKGSLMSIDRHGINRGDVGPLAKSSFEETTDMLINAGVFSDYDKINGVSANIMLGQLPPCGTGDSEILMDEEGYLAILKERGQKRKQKQQQEREEKIEDVPNVTIVPACDITELAFDHKLPKKTRTKMRVDLPDAPF